MNINYQNRHKLAKLNPYNTVVELFDCREDSLLVGIKNVSSIPNTLIHKLEPFGFELHTIDKKSLLAGRAVDIDVKNPITGRIMSGSSSGTAVNVFAGINDLGIGNDGGGSVLAPAISVNILSFISKKIEEDRKQNIKANTDGMVAGNSIGFMARKRDVLLKAIEISTGLKAADDYGVVYSDREYEGINSKVIDVMEAHTERKTLTNYLQETLSKCDVFIVKEGPIDIDGFGDSLFGHFDERTKAFQEKANKGYVRVCNIAEATAMSIPQKELGVATLLMCENKPEKIEKLLKCASFIKDIEDPLIDRYFLDLDNYFWEGYQR